MPLHPIVVIGAGLSGASAAWRLAQRGHEVVVLERSTPANEYGSSHGSARIFRYTYPQSFYTALVARARTGWDELESEAGAELIRYTGCLDFGALRDPSALGRILDAQGIDNELLSAADAEERWPGFSFSAEVLWHQAAGVIDAERSVEAMLALARDAGAQVRTGWTACRVVRYGGGYAVQSEGGDVVFASQVVVAAGGWLPELLERLGLPRAAVAALPTLQVRQEQALHFPYRDQGDAWPTFIDKRDDIQVYGLPGGRDAGHRGQKVAQYNGGRVIGSALEHDRTIDERGRDRIIDYVARSLPGLVPEPYAETTCLFTNAPDDEFIIDRVEGVTILSPCSGHGAKFAPLIGELAADLVEGDRDVPSRFRPLHGVAA